MVEYPEFLNSEVIMKKLLTRLWPRHTILPLLSVILFNFLAFSVTKWILGGYTVYDLTTSWDRAIPFIPAFVLLYAAAFVQWVVGYTVIAHESSTALYRAVGADIVAKLLCAAIFLAFPMTMERPEITGTGLFDRGMKLVYFFDAPTNLFPSIHVLESWMVARCAFGLKKPPKWYKWVMCAVSLGVFASVLFVKQHVLLDIAGGIAVAELGLLLVRPLRVDRALRAVNERLCGVCV